MANQKIKIVLIEDDLVLGSLILELLVLNDFDVEWFKDGAEAFKHLQKRVPDIIISDFMMPNMNGEELFLKIRKDSIYNAVPFIMVTANMEDGVRTRQLKNGVNDFILKPFKVKELIYKISNMMDFKKNIEKKLKPDPFSKVTIKLSEKDFITSVNTILCENLKSKVDIDELSKKLFVSKSTLDKKIRKQTNKNITQYIREFKLDYAVKLIDSGEINVQFLVDETGFNSFSYFSTSFKAYLGMTPTEYIKSNHTKNSSLN
jgi:YesN/AraC family two-component response regulator